MSSLPYSDSIAVIWCHLNMYLQILPSAKIIWNELRFLLLLGSSLQAIASRFCKWQKYIKAGLSIEGGTLLRQQCFLGGFLGAGFTPSFNYSFTSFPLHHRYFSHGSSSSFLWSILTYWIGAPSGFVTFLKHLFCRIQSYRSLYSSGTIVGIIIWFDSGPEYALEYDPAVGISIWLENGCSSSVVTSVVCLSDCLIAATSAWMVSSLLSFEEIRSGYLVTFSLEQEEQQQFNVPQTFVLQDSRVIEVCQLQNMIKSWALSYD